MHSINTNLLLNALPPGSGRSLSEHIEIMDAPARMELFEPGDAIKKIYFPIDSVVSITAPVGGANGEVATVGLEGMIGLPAIFGTNLAHMRLFVQIAGKIAVLDADRFRQAVDQDEAVRSVMLRYANALFLQIGQSVVCNQRHSLRQRSARWLLMTHDRVPGDHFHLTHEFLAVMLGVRRAGVTVAAGNLQKAGLIRYRRGEIAILDRPGLESVSCECYRFIADMYQQLIGQAISKS